MTRIAPETGARVHRRDGGQCRYCLCLVYVDAPKWASAWRPTLDHVMPRTLGGGNATSNLVVACDGCNTVKADAHGAPWIPYPRPIQPVPTFEWPGGRGRRPTIEGLQRVMDADAEARAGRLPLAPCCSTLGYMATSFEDEMDRRAEVLAARFEAAPFDPSGWDGFDHLCDMESAGAYDDVAATVVRF